MQIAVTLRVKVGVLALYKSKPQVHVFVTLLIETELKPVRFKPVPNTLLVLCGVTSQSQPDATYPDKHGSLVA